MDRASWPGDPCRLPAFFYNCWLPDFAISGHVMQKFGQRSKLQSPSQPSSADRCFQNFVKCFLLIVSTNLGLTDFPISGHVTQKIKSNFTISNSFTPLFVCLCFRKFVHCFSFNSPFRAMTEFSILGHMTQKLGQRSKFRRFSQPSFRANIKTWTFFTTFIHKQMFSNCGTLFLFRSLYNRLIS